MRLNNVQTSSLNLQPLTENEERIQRCHTWSILVIPMSIWAFDANCLLLPWYHLHLWTQKVWIATTETAHITLHKIPLLHLSSWDNIFRLTMRPGLFLVPGDVPPQRPSLLDIAWRLHGEIWNLAWDEAPEPMMPRPPATRPGETPDRSVYGTWSWWPLMALDLWPKRSSGWHSMKFKYVQIIVSIYDLLDFWRTIGQMMSMNVNDRYDLEHVLLSSFVPLDLQFSNWWHKAGREGSNIPCHWNGLSCAGWQATAARTRLQIP